MKIFKENGRIRIQCMDLKTKSMLFDFTIENDKTVLEELGYHIQDTIKEYVNNSD